MARRVTAAQKHQLMTKLLSTQAGRQRIAATVQEPLRKLRDYQSVGRKGMFVDELPDGSLPIYDQDPDVPAYVVGEEGDSVETVAKSKRLMVPLFEIATYPKVPFTQVKERRFDILRRIRTKAQNELFRLEDRKIFKAMDASSTANTVNTKVPVQAANFNMDVLADTFAKVERHGLRVDKVYMNPLRYPVIRKAGRDYVDFETQRELLRTGYVGNLWGSMIFMSPEVPESGVYIITEAEYYGVIPCRVDLTVLPADDAPTRSFGWVIFEAVGVGIFNSDLGSVKVSIV